MKFHDLAIGQRFELDGANYVKTSPVLASPEVGGSTKFMARYVVVRPLDGERRPAAAQEKRMISGALALEAFAVYHAACRQAVASLDGELPAARVEALRDTIESARRDFLAAVNG